MPTNIVFRLLAVPMLLLCAATSVRAREVEIPLQNPSFDLGPQGNGVPQGWLLYGGSGKNQKLGVAEPGIESGRALLIEDGDPAAEIGVQQTFPLDGDLLYRATLKVRRLLGRSSHGAYLQLRFLPSGRKVQVGLTASGVAQWTEISVRGSAPPDTTQGIIYLYTHKAPTPALIVDDLRLMSLGKAPPPVEAPAAPKAPPPVPELKRHVYRELKDLHLTTHLVRARRAAITIVVPASGVYDGEGTAIQGAVAKLTGVVLPVATDGSAEAEVPVKRNLIVLGNRSTSKTVNSLYDRFYTLLDLKYPGPAGHVLRTLHNPFGNGFNVILVGASDLTGMRAATKDLVDRLAAHPRTKDDVSLGWTMQIKLGNGVQVPTDVEATWDDSITYGSYYFGWQNISKRMAAYYMTGDPSYAREAVRLAFPDERTLKEVGADTRIQNKKEPLVGPYEYNAPMMILFWDLIEESPVFTDAERLRITNAFARQLVDGTGYIRNSYKLRAPPNAVGSRHSQWGAITLYCLGRYFQKDYPSPVWAQCVRGAKLSFASLHKHAWVHGEGDWIRCYNSGTLNPIFTYLVLSGDRKPLDNGVIAKLLRAQETLFSGKPKDPYLENASLGFLHKAAYLTGDGRWLHYRDRTGMDTSVFRLGQSFWPGRTPKPEEPVDNVGKWNVHQLPGPAWRVRGRDSGLKLDESFYFGAFRSSCDATGDHILLDGYNGVYRNPYHAFAILDLRLSGTTLLKGYRNQVLTSADGMVEPKVAMDAALLYRNVLGGTAIAVGEVPRSAYCNWRRTIAQRVGRYAVVADDLMFRADTDNMKVTMTWQPVNGAWQPERNAAVIWGAAAGTVPPDWIHRKALVAECTSEPDGPDMLAKLDTIDIMLLRARAPGAWLEMPFLLKGTVRGECFVDLVNYVDRGTVRFYVDGRRVGKDYLHHSGTATRVRVPLGRCDLAPGKHALRVESMARQPEVDTCYVGLVGLTIRPDTVAHGKRASPFELRPADRLPVAERGALRMAWVGRARKGGHRTFFALLARSSPDPEQPLACIRLADNAAAMRLPEPAIAVVRKYEGTNAELAIIAADHLHGHNMLSANADGVLLSADAPLDVDWDFAREVVQIDAAGPAVLSLALETPTGVKHEGAPAEMSVAENGLSVLRLSTGHHVLTGAEPVRRARARLRERLPALLARAEAERRRLPEPGAASAATKPVGPQLRGSAALELAKSPIVDLLAIPTEGGEIICAAAGKTVNLLTPGGDRIRMLTTDGQIRMLHWWREHRLLLVGCVDEKVIAFELGGRRRWVFVSKMAPEVKPMAKPYWEKTARGHEGIHGLHTGAFLNGKSQCFVGSACTLEIIDENGALVQRQVVFWGPASKFLLVSGPDESVNLLIARSPNGSDSLAVFNSRTGRLGRSFHQVPVGHTFVGGWMAQNRVALVHEDLDADGTGEVISATNGTWNRVTVYAEDGSPLHNAQFGPGARAPARNIRGVDVADLGGDGAKEIVVGLSGKLVVALDSKCEKIWAKAMRSVPSVVKCVARQGSAGHWIAVGCGDGSVQLLDGRGQCAWTAEVTGMPTELAAARGAGDAAHLLVGTDKGEVQIFAVPE